jgi:hypothetical protein
VSRIDVVSLIVRVRKAMALNSSGVRVEGPAPLLVGGAEAEDNGDTAGRIEELDHKEKTGVFNIEKETSQQPEYKDKGSDPEKPAPNNPKVEWGHEKDISFFSLFKYADWVDVILMALGSLGAMGDGLALPAALFITSGLINTFGSNGSLSISDPAGFETEINKVCPMLLFPSASTFLAIYEPFQPL